MFELIDWQLALNYYEQGLTIQREFANAVTAEILCNIGVLRLENANYLKHKIDR
jgi:hypothetical protein